MKMLFVCYQAITKNGEHTDIRLSLPKYAPGCKHERAFSDSENAYVLEMPAGGSAAQHEHGLRAVD
jgi:hypothetical protein